MTPTLTEIAKAFSRVLGVTLEPGFSAEPGGGASANSGITATTTSSSSSAPSPATTAPPATQASTGTAVPAGLTTPAAPTAGMIPSSPIVFTEHASRGWHLDVTVTAPQVLDTARLMDRLGFCLDMVTGVDWMAQQAMEVVYDYLHFDSSVRVVVRTRVPREAAEVPTISEIFPGANWHERETHEFLGIRFAGHPNLTPLLLPEDATFHPLRKDFVA
ncbi:MAG: NADH-quinone oxidoreductase subunit C [Verrucomicrobiales bacterium]|nr:NADH-quinone oxidoreductase subunit C [Verrucomicrobiales bacterium]